MLTQTKQKNRLNLDKPQKNETIQVKASKKPDIDKSVIDKFMSGKTSKISMFNETGVEDINNMATQLFNQMGLLVDDSNGDPITHTNVLKRVNSYLARFPEIEYLVDMISSSVIYTSSSNTKKIQFILNGEYKVLNKKTKADKTDTTADATSTSPKVEITDIKLDTEMQAVDSWYEDLSLEVGNLFKKNNIKLSLYSMMNSITKYGCGLFYVDDPVKQSEVSFYSLDEVSFQIKQKALDNSHIASDIEGKIKKDTLFISTDGNDEIKKFKSRKVSVTVNEDGNKLKTNNLYFISEKGIYGKSMILKIIHYLKIIELLELSLLIERLSKSKTTHVQKLDLAKVEEEDIAPTMMLYRNLLKNQMSLNYDEDNDGMQLDIVKNLVDCNMLVPTEDKNLDITSLRSEFKPLLDDVNYYQDKIYLSLGIPLHYRKGGDSKAYVNNNMLIMHDNVYSMKIRHHQLIINNLLTFQIENWLNVNHPKLTIKYLNINIPEFIPISERKETDLDKSGKFVTMFSQLEQMLGIKLKEEFILNKLFPNDIMSDIVDVATDEEVEQDLEDMKNEDEQEDIASLFESGFSSFKKESGLKLFNVKNFGNFNVIKYKLKLNVDQ